MSDRFDDLPVLAELGDSLRHAFAAAQAESEPASASATTSVPAAEQPAKPAASTRARRWLPRWHQPLPVVVAALLLGTLGAGTAAATLTVLRGSPIPAPKPADLQPVMTAEASTQQVSPLRSADPGGGLAFALRTGTSKTGLDCVTVGQDQGGRFGLTGNDGVFRAMPTSVVDGCGKATERSAAVFGARVFDAPNYSEVRTVLYGLGGDSLRSATAIVRGQERRLDLFEGSFLLALPGYREDNVLQLRLEFEDGKTTTHDLGEGWRTVLDPSGPAWVVDSGAPGAMDETATVSCTWLSRARPGPGTPKTPMACGAANGRAVSEPKAPWFFNIRRFAPGDGSGPAARNHWAWHRAPARTIVWGYTDPDRVKTVVATAGGARGTAAPTFVGGFAIVLPGTVRTEDVRVALTLTDGTTRRFAGPTNLVPSGVAR